MNEWHVDESRLVRPNLTERGLAAFQHGAFEVAAAVK